MVRVGLLFLANLEVTSPVIFSVLTTALCNFYLTTWEEYHTGVLYLGYFNGPVEGILMVTFFYFVTGINGEINYVPVSH